MRCIGRRACFETRPGCAGPLLSMKQVVDGIEKLPHPEVPREARPRRTHDPTPAIRDSCPASQRNPPSVSRPPRWVTPGFRRTSPALRAQGAGRRATGRTPAARCARPRRARPRRAQPPPEPRPAPPGHARPFATIRGRSRDAPPGRSWPEAAAILAPRAAATDEACGRASPTTPARSAAGRRDRVPGAWDCECRVAARADCPSFPSRTARARRAREARRDQDQVVEIPGFEIQETGDNRKDRADRQRFPASTGLQSQRGRNIYS